ncbi:MAG: hypothetical protein WCA89_09100 [Terracidiphilus sp.]|jgi:hypothetical protein
MINRLAILSAILLASVACTTPLFASGQKAPSSTTTPQAQPPKITQKVTFQGSCKGNIADSDGIPVITALTPPRDILALAQRLRAENPNQTLDNGTGLIWKTQPLSCDSVLVVESNDYKGHTFISFLNDPKNSFIGIEGPVMQNGDGSFTVLIAKSLILPDGTTHSLLDPTLQTTECQIYSSHAHYLVKQIHSRDFMAQEQQQNEQARRLLAKAQARWASHIIKITCSVRMKTPDGHLTNVNVEFDVTPRPPWDYTEPEPMP